MIVLIVDGYGSDMRTRRLHLLDHSVAIQPFACSYVVTQTLLDRLTILRETASQLLRMPN